MNQDHVVLVNERDEPIGTAEKLDAHQRGVLHRAFSIFVFNPQGELLLQQRALTKYHSGGLWTNTCCGHPRPEENTLDAAHRRLQEEMGFDCPLHEAFHFTYTAPLDHGLTEHEYDHVLFGTYEGVIQIDPAEAATYRWISIADLTKEIEEQPERYTAWFKICFSEVLNTLALKKIL